MHLLISGDVIPLHAQERELHRHERLYALRGRRVRGRFYARCRQRSGGATMGISTNLSLLRNPRFCLFRGSTWISR